MWLLLPDMPSAVAYNINVVVIATISPNDIFISHTNLCAIS